MRRRDCLQGRSGIWVGSHEVFDSVKRRRTLGSLRILVKASGKLFVGESEVLIDLEYLTRADPRASKLMIRCLLDLWEIHKHLITFSEVLLRRGGCVGSIQVLLVF
jgi:hypothetical protein